MNWCCKSLTGLFFSPFALTISVTHPPYNSSLSRGIFLRIWILCESRPTGVKDPMKDIGKTHQKMLMNRIVTSGYLPDHFSCHVSNIYTSTRRYLFQIIIFFRIAKYLLSGISLIWKNFSIKSRGIQWTDHLFGIIRPQLFFHHELLRKLDNRILICLRIVNQILLLCS